VTASPFRLRTVVALIAASAAVVGLAVPVGATDPPPLRDICFPVSGPVTYTDTFGDPRDGHLHQGEDLMGHKLQHLLAAHDATVSALEHDSAGDYLFLTDADGWQYWYIHINNDTPGTDDGANPWEWAFAPGIDVGAHVHEGQFVAFMGDSGNAESVGPHLHFELHQPDGSWSGVPVNPYSSLLAARTCAWAPPEMFTTQQYEDFLGRAPDDGGLSWWTYLLDTQDMTVVDLVDTFLDSAEFGGTVAPVARLYFAVFRRIPDFGGLGYWLSQFRNGMSLGTIADNFVASGEFVSTYGALDDGAFVDLVYHNVLGRDPDPAGRQYWLDHLAFGMGRGALMTGFSESAEYKALTKSKIDVTMVYAAMLRRAPDQGGFDYWTTRDRSEFVRGIIASPEYGARFG
jgi:Domain of unknown function (DUF4214)